MTSVATAGYQGVAKIGATTIVQVQSCEISAAGETYDVTVMGGTATPVWKAFISGLRSYTVKIAGLWDQVNDADQATLWTDFNSGVDVAWSFSPNAGTNTYSGNAKFTSLPFKFDVKAAETIEWDLQGNGALAYA